ncbi:MAG: hypothetical protein E6K78_03955 [Candidatus Eisenbacteria bacterium]|uniref:Uncharacterized protein n=1 Tax=Eiseniibacteriota bacterium TaxID=2212470 RepID=A0A538TVK2_UNCEI|nr:MAG: hypothetical protein E6K78_03955 [Candidatus Eisenbacteria bacterium]
MGGPLTPWSSPNPSRTTFTKMSSSGSVASANDSMPTPRSRSDRSTDSGEAAGSSVSFHSWLNRSTARTPGTPCGTRSVRTSTAWSA